MLSAATLLAATVLPVEVARVPTYTEGIVFDNQGNGYFSHGGMISRIAPGGQVSVWAKTGAPNGHKILADGTHLVCDARQHAVLRLDARGNVIGKAASECNGRPLRAPNDLALDAHGGFYFTDPGGSRERPRGTLHYTDSAGGTHLVDEGLFFPNGLVVRPGGRSLLVAESLYNRILEYELLAPGKVGWRRVFADLPRKGPGQIDNQPDGIALDEEGNLYVAHYGMRQVQVLDPAGRLVRSLPAGNLTASNVAFGGPGRGQLFVTGALAEERGSEGAVFRLDLQGVRGAPLPPGE